MLVGSTRVVRLGGCYVVDVFTEHGFWAGVEIYANAEAAFDRAVSLSALMPPDVRSEFI